MVGCNSLLGETFVLRVKVVSNRVSEDARRHVGTNVCWKRLFKVWCSWNVQEYGYHENWQGVYGMLIKKGTGSPWDLS